MTIRSQENIDMDNSNMVTAFLKTNLPTHTHTQNTFKLGMQLLVTDTCLIF